MQPEQQMTFREQAEAIQRRAVDASPPGMMSLADAEVVGVLTRDLHEVLCMRTPRDPPGSFMADQDEDVRQAAWIAALDAAEAAIRAKLRQKGVDA